MRTFQQFNRRLTQTLILRYSRRADSLTLTVIPRNHEDGDSRISLHQIKSVTRELPELIEQYA